jgi:CubicO group peptidase (beta-lactamase class C family)
LTTDTGYSLSFGYVDMDGTEISLASGPKKPARFTNITLSGDLTPHDPMQMGSGTKPFTAAALLQLVDQGKLKTSDLAS